MAGYLRPSILWHLHRTGGANTRTLARLIGHPSQYLRRVMNAMRESGQIVERRNCQGLYELTVKGIDAARAVDVSQVESAEPNPPALPIH